MAIADVATSVDVDAVTVVTLAAVWVEEEPRVVTADVATSVDADEVMVLPFVAVEVEEDLKVAIVGEEEVGLSAAIVVEGLAADVEDLKASRSLGKLSERNRYAPC